MYQCIHVRLEWEMTSNISCRKEPHFLYDSEPLQQRIAGSLWHVARRNLLLLYSC